jgi:hypothetical protein
MKQESKYQKSTREAPSLVERLLTYSMAFIFSSFFVLTQTLAASHAQNADPESRGVNGIHSDIGFFHEACDHHNLFPLTSPPVLPEPETSDEDAATDFLSHGTATLCVSACLHERIELTSANSLFRQLSISIDNRATISLFILHHTWKTFLS